MYVFRYNQFSIIYTICKNTELQNFNYVYTIKSLSCRILYTINCQLIITSGIYNLFFYIFANIKYKKYLLLKKNHLHLFMSYGNNLFTFLYFLYFILDFSISFLFYTDNETNSFDDILYKI